MDIAVIQTELIPYLPDTHTYTRHNNPRTTTATISSRNFHPSPRVYLTPCARAPLSLTKNSIIRDTRAQISDAFFIIAHAESPRERDIYKDRLRETEKNQSTTRTHTRTFCSNSMSIMNPVSSSSLMLLLFPVIIPMPVNFHPALVPSRPLPSATTF